MLNADQHARIDDLVRERAGTIDGLRRLFFTDANPIVNAYLGPRSPSERDGEVPGVRVVTGGWCGYPFADCGYDLSELLPCMWQAVPQLGDWPYSMFWANRTDRAVLHRCEGDATLYLATSAEAWRPLVRWLEATP